MKQNKYEKPEKILVDGQLVNFHYDRNERLKMTGSLLNNENSSFFSKKFRHLHILIVDLLIIAIIGIILTSFYGRSKSIIYNDIIYSLTRKSYSNDKILNFNIQIKNESSNKRTLPGNYFDFQLFNINNENTLKKEIFISKNIFMPDEFYIENIVINDVKPGSYKAILTIINNNKIEMEFKTGK